MDDSTVDEDDLDFSSMAPEEIFARFDTDGSGLINLDEFKLMLDMIGIKMTTAKALKYFKMCDVDDSGEIDFEEFKVALFACDPNNGNPIGFAPSSLLAPLDAFEMFDEDNSKSIDEDEFFFCLEYLKLTVTDEKQEKLFSKHDRDGSGSIDYDEFKQIWLSVADVKKELEDRGAEIAKFASKRSLQRQLEALIDEEEEAERRAMAEAERWRQWRLLIEQKKVLITRARRRAHVELAKALDSAGQVYVFGRGSSRQFDAPARRTRNEDDLGSGLVEMLWTRRVTAGRSDEVSNLQSMRDGSEEAAALKLARAELASSPFVGLSVAVNTSRLWGRRVRETAVTDSVVLACSDLGETWTWGGVDHWWREVEQDAYGQTHFNGDTTPRSQLLLTTAGLKEENTPHTKKAATTTPSHHTTQDHHTARRRRSSSSSSSSDDPVSEALKSVLGYFGCWKAAPSQDADRVKFYSEQLLPSVKHARLSSALESRGKTPGDQTKMELVLLLHRDLLLEKRVLGERAHRRIHELEEEMRDLKTRRRFALAKKLKRDVVKMWAPLREIQAEEDALERARKATRLVETIARRERLYQEWRVRAERDRGDQNPAYTPRGNSVEIHVAGVTSRGPASKQRPKGYASVTSIAGGSHHLLAVHQSGALYAWGVGGSGRLGLDLTQHGDPRGDAGRPTLVQSLTSVPVIRASGGHSHTACITVDRQLLVWGSAASGKLGLGPIDRGQNGVAHECYCSVPTPLALPPLRPSSSSFTAQQPTRPCVRSVSCGAAHTACSVTDGRLFVWGCGDGGRLGLGETDAGALNSLWRPRLVESLWREGLKIGPVACGNAHTLVATHVTTTSSQRDPQTCGGQVLVAGSAAVLGRFYAEFELVRGDLEGQVATAVAAGFSHSAVLTNEGELYCWGQNHEGCCAQPAANIFLQKPTLAACLYSRPANLALGKPCRQSSCYGGLDAHLGTDGNVDGGSAQHCASTQQDPQAWWQVDLGDFGQLQSVRIHNRTDEPSDQTMPRDKFSSRLTPAWVMCSQSPYGDAVGGNSLTSALQQSVARMHLTKDQSVTVWRVPENISARYVRIQLEGFNFLHFAQIEVFGTVGIDGSAGRCGSVVCGKHCTVAVVLPATDPAAVARVYRRAVSADAHNADILRQRETFALEYDKCGRGEELLRGPCVTCTGGQKCETCAMKFQFRDELKKLPLGVAGRVLTLDETADLLLTAAKPKLQFTPNKPKKDTSISGMLTRALGRRGSSFKKPKSAKVNPGGDDDEDDDERSEVAGDLDHGMTNNANIDVVMKTAKKKKKKKKKKEKPERAE